MHEYIHTTAAYSTRRDPRLHDAHGGTTLILVHSVVLQILVTQIRQIMVALLIILVVEEVGGLEQKV